MSFMLSQTVLLCVLFEMDARAAGAKVDTTSATNPATKAATKYELTLRRTIESACATGEASRTDWRVLSLTPVEPAFFEVEEGRLRRRKNSSSCW